MVERLRSQFFQWFLRVAATPKSTDFFRAVEEWKKAELSAPIRYALSSSRSCSSGCSVYLQSEKDRRRYDGRISPRAIGRRKDFWNRLTIAYRDLRIQELVEVYKGRKATGYKAVMEAFFTDFEELYGDLPSSDPCEFPGFRISIECAQEQGTAVRHRHGIGTFNDGAADSCRRRHFQHRLSSRRVRYGERKFCKLLVDCAERELPVIGFISSGHADERGRGSALFRWRLNDRITRSFVIRNCPSSCSALATARAARKRVSSRTPRADVLLQRHEHAVCGPDRRPIEPAVHRNVVELLCRPCPGDAGLVKHPFFDDLDDRLRKIDPDIPLPTASSKSCIASWPDRCRSNGRSWPGGARNSAIVN